MAGLMKHETKTSEPVGFLNRFDDMFDDMFADWARMRPFRRQALHGRGWWPEEVIRVDEYRQDGALVVRAELPGIDPDKDVKISVSDGELVIEAERREEHEAEEKGYLRHELRHGSLSRMLSLPDGVSESDIKASYKDGILEIHIPAAAPAPSRKIPVTKG